MSRGVAAVVAIVGLVVAVLGAVPWQPSLLGRLNGLGGFGTGHNTSDLIVVIGVVLLVVGVYSLIRGRPAT